MDTVKLFDTLERLHANLTLLGARKVNRNTLYYANHFMANSGDRTHNATVLLDAVYSVFRAFRQDVEHVDWRIMVGRMINRNIGNINIDELRDMVSHYDRMDVPTKVTIKQAIDNIRQGHGAQYMPGYIQPLDAP